MEKKSKSNMSKNILIILLALLGIGAIGGGIVLIISPMGELIGIPLSEYKNLPFNSYLIPGITLLSVIGILPLLLIIALLKKPKSKVANLINIFKDMHWSWSFCIYIAFALLGWIHIQLIFLQGVVHWLHTFYVFYAILILIVALLPSNRKQFIHKA